MLLLVLLEMLVVLVTLRDQLKARVGFVVEAQLVVMMKLVVVVVVVGGHGVDRPR